MIFSASFNETETKIEFHLQVYIASMCSAWSGKLNGNRIEEAGWFENVEHVHLFLIPMRLFYKHIYGGFLCLFVCLFVSNLNSSGLFHFGSIFTNEEQKKTGSWRDRCLSPWANSVLLPLMPTVLMTLCCCHSCRPCWWLCCCHSCRPCWWLCAVATHADRVDDSVLLPLMPTVLMTVCCCHSCRPCWWRH